MRRKERKAVLHNVTERRSTGPPGVASRGFLYCSTGIHARPAPRPRSPQMILKRDRPEGL